MALLVNEDEEGDNVSPTHAVRYYDKYVKQDGKWLISEREQYFVFSKTKKFKQLHFPKVR